MKRITLVIATILLAFTGYAQAQKSVSETVNEVIMSRRSIRKYKPVPVGRDTLEHILLAGINAPSGLNKQSWEIRIVDKPETLEAIKDAMAEANPSNKAAARGSFRESQVVMFIANDSGYECSPIDCGLLCENMMLTAWSMGVGSVCLGSPIRFISEPENPSCKAIQDVQKKLGFSKGYNLIICVGFGYANESPKAKPRDKSKYRFLD